MPVDDTVSAISKAASLLGPVVFMCASQMVRFSEWLGDSTAASRRVDTHKHPCTYTHSERMSARLGATQASLCVTGLLRMVGRWRAAAVAWGSLAPAPSNRNPKTSYPSLYSPRTLWLPSLPGGAMARGRIGSPEALFTESGLGTMASKASCAVDDSEMDLVVPCVCLSGLV
jgi:hypothetical protein